MRGYILSIASWVAVLAMFSYIGYGLAKQFDYINPPGLYHQLTPQTYTNQAYEDLEKENAQYKLKWQQADSVIMDILNSEKTWTGK